MKQIRAMGFKPLASHRESVFTNGEYFLEKDDMDVTRIWTKEQNGRYGSGNIYEQKYNYELLINKLKEIIK